MVEFKKGDRVTFELAPSLDRPRWDHGDDYKPSGEWGFGTVLCVDNVILLISLDNSSFSSVWTIPIGDHPSATKDQWTLPGFFHLADRIEAPIPYPGTCQCDSHQMAHFGHSEDCPSYREKELTYGY